MLFQFCYHNFSNENKKKKKRRNEVILCSTIFIINQIKICVSTYFGMCFLLSWKSHVINTMQIECKKKKKNTNCNEEQSAEIKMANNKNDLKHFFFATSIIIKMVMGLQLATYKTYLNQIDSKVSTPNRFKKPKSERSQTYNRQKQKKKQQNDKEKTSRNKTVIINLKRKKNGIFSK